MKSIYDFPDVYDAVMQHPPAVVEEEVASIQRLLGAHGINGRRILEVACGAGAHGIRLAQAGFEVTGFDASPAMLGRARQHAAAAQVTLTLAQADWTDFELEGRPSDCAIFMFETFPLITEYDDLVKHFRCVRRHLRSGGLYVIDIDAHRSGVGAAHETFGQRTQVLEDGWVEIWGESLPGDWVQGVSHMVQHFRIHRGGEMIETADEWRIRNDSPWHLRRLVETLEGWSLVGSYSWRDLSEDIADEEHYFMVLK